MAPMKQTQFTLRAGLWFFWEMILGYGDDVAPYHSPIFVTRVEPLKSGTSRLRLHFWNVFYAQGVQDFDLTIRILKRARRFLVAEIDYPDALERCAVIGIMTFEWLNRFAPIVIRAQPPKGYVLGNPPDPQRYLNLVYPTGQFRT
jgi:hypothetical protein